MTTMDRGELLYEGKAKQVYRTADPDLLIQHFKDDATAFNAKKRGTVVDKGILNNRMSEVLFRFLEEEGVPTHFVRRLSERDMLIRRCEIVKIEVVARNVIAGSLAKRLGRAEGEPLPEPILEHYYKDDALDDPMINDWHVRFLRLATPQELSVINERALRVSAVPAGRPRCRASTSPRSPASWIGRARRSRTRSTPSVSPRYRT